jgi:heptosyltransferase-1
LRILIIKTSSLGDIIHALPVLEYLRQAEPSATIDWVVDEAFADLLSGNPLIDRLLLVAFRRWKKKPFARQTWQEVMGFVKELRQQRYDLIFDLQGNLKSALLCFLSPSDRKIGFSREHLQEKLNALFTTEQVAFKPNDRNAVQRYLRITSAPFSLNPELAQIQTDIVTSAEDNSVAAKALEGTAHPLILFHTGTTWQTKLWHEEGWQRLGQELLERYPKATIAFSWGNTDEKERAARLAEKLGRQALLLPQLTLKQFAALLKRCDLVIGGDTGPVHLAAAVGTSTVSFYRSTDGSRNGPYGSKHIVVQSPLPCAICMRKQCERDEECRRSISVEAIMYAAHTIINQERN